MELKISFWPEISWQLSEWVQLEPGRVEMGHLNQEDSMVVVNVLWVLSMETGMGFNSWKQEFLLLCNGWTICYFCKCIAQLHQNRRTLSEDGSSLLHLEEFQKVVSVADVVGRFLVTQSSVAWVPASLTTLVGLTGTGHGMAVKSTQKLTLTSFCKRHNWVVMSV